MNALVERKGGFSASAIFTNFGTMCVTSGAIIKSQRIQLERKSKGDTDKIYKKAATSDKSQLEAQEVKEKNFIGEKLTAKDPKTIIIYVLPAAKCTDSPSRYTTKEQINIILSELDNHWSEYIPIRTDTEVAVDAEVIVEDD